MKLFQTIIMIVLMGTISACSQNNPSDSESRKMRQILMKEWRTANDTLKSMIENPANFDAEIVKEQAQYFVDSAPIMWTHFADSNDKGQAKDTIWSNASDFKMQTEDFNNAAKALLTATEDATQLSDVEPQINILAESCGTCHKIYKK